MSRRKRQNAIRYLMYLRPRGGGCVPLDQIDGDVPVSSAFSHPADAVIAFTVTTVPSTSFARVAFRYVDASNHWHIRIDSSGNIALFEQVATVFEIRGTDSGVTAGSRIAVVAEGQTIDVYLDSELLFTYASAASFETEEDGLVYALAGGSAIADLKVWDLDCRASEGV